MPMARGASGRRRTSSRRPRETAAPDGRGPQGGLSLRGPLTRPGRLDTRVTRPPPDRRGRGAIVKPRPAGGPLAPDADLAATAGITPALVGADLRNLVTEAALAATRKAETMVAAADF